jgi:hypothetical protein
MGAKGKKKKDNNNNKNKKENKGALWCNQRFW